MPRTLITGFGNVLRGDDGFGVEVIRRLEREGIANEQTVLLEVGTGGVALAQALVIPFGRLIVLDAIQREGVAGNLYVLKVDAVEALRSIDMHMAVPSRALGLAQVLGVLPPDVLLVGCEPLETEEFSMQLSAPVSAAADRAVGVITRLLAANDALIAGEPVRG